jgi:hypothetical protein
MKTTNPELVPTGEAARLMGINLSTLQGWRYLPTDQQPIRWYRIGRRNIYYRRSDIADYLVSRQCAPATPAGSAAKLIQSPGQNAADDKGVSTAHQT